MDYKSTGDPFEKQNHEMSPIPFTLPDVFSSLCLLLKQLQVSAEINAQPKVKRVMF